MIITFLQSNFGDLFVSGFFINLTIKTHQPWIHLVGSTIFRNGFFAATRGGKYFRRKCRIDKKNLQTI